MNASFLPALPDLLLHPVVEASLREDLGRAGDITTASLGSLADRRGEARLVARQAGKVAGLDLARLAFQICAPSTVWEALACDGDAVAAGTVLAKIEAPAAGLLMAERVALNFLCHLSGIATETHKLVEAVQGTKARICCTRKTTPGLRFLEKYAVRAGGGANHRFGLDDAIMIKDNHIALAGGLRPAVLAARQAAGHMVRIELEVDTLDQLDQALDLPIDVVLLDNMPPSVLSEAVRRIGGRFVTEASGGVTLQTAAAIAATGVDIISVGWITHSAPILDIGLDV